MRGRLLSHPTAQLGGEPHASGDTGVIAVRMRQSVEKTCDISWRTHGYSSELVLECDDTVAKLMSGDEARVE